MSFFERVIRLNPCNYKRRFSRFKPWKPSFYYSTSYFRSVYRRAGVFYIFTFIRSLILLQARVSNKKHSVMVWYISRKRDMGIIKL